MTVYTIKEYPSYVRDRKRAIRQGLDVDELDSVLLMLSQGKTLPKKYKNHKLSGEWSGVWECHIHDNFLLIYAKDKKKLILWAIATGTHDELFKHRWWGIPAIAASILLSLHHSVW